jgi:hypothetical protein
LTLLELAAAGAAPPNDDDDDPLFLSAILDAHSWERDNIVVAAAAAAATEISLELLVLEAPAVARRPRENIYYFFAALDCRKQVPVNCLSP